MPISTTLQRYLVEYNRLVTLAREHGITRGPNGRRLRPWTNIATSISETAARVEALRLHIQQRVPVNIAALPIASRPSIPQRRPQHPARSRLERHIEAFVTSVNVRRQEIIPPVVVSVTPTFGVEIECLFPSAVTPTAIAHTLTEAGVTCETEFYNHGRRSHWKIVTDGSLRSNPGTVAYELVSPILSGEAGLEQIAKVCRLLQALGTVVNRSCGLHVHIGVSSAFENVAFYKRLIRLYKNHGPMIETVLAPSRRGGSNTYCRELRPYTEAALDACSSISAVITLVNGPDPRNDRYYKLNLNAYFRHRTVEFRQHQGTIDAQKATMWTRFCLKVVAAASKTTTLTTSDNLSAFLDQIEVNQEERSYFLSRQSHFQQLENTGDL